MLHSHLLLRTLFLQPRYFHKKKCDKKGPIGSNRSPQNRKAEVKAEEIPYGSSLWKTKSLPVPKPTSSQPQRRSSETEMTVRARSAPPGSFIFTLCSCLSCSLWGQSTPACEEQRRAIPALFHDSGLNVTALLRQSNLQEPGWTANTKALARPRVNAGAGSGIIGGISYSILQWALELQEVTWGSEAFSLRLPMTN